MKRRALDRVRDRFNERENGRRRYEFFETLQKGENVDGARYGAWGNPTNRTALVGFAEQYSENWRRVLWLASMTQLVFSHREPIMSGGIWPFQTIDHPILVAAGSRDAGGDVTDLLDYYDDLRDVTDASPDVPGTRLLALDMGHSMHDENPGFIALQGSNFFEDRRFQDRSTGIGLYVGDVITLRHINTGARLHSGDARYDHAGSSRQFRVTAFDRDHPDNRWIVLPAHARGAEDHEGRIGQQSIIRLMHLTTGRNLHSHPGVRSPISGQQEVTCFGSNGVGDTNDDWRLKFVVDNGGDRKGYGATVGLIHVRTDATLHSHPLRGPATGGEQEVSGFAGRDSNDMWVIERDHVGLFFGDRIILRHAETWARLRSDPTTYSHANSSRQQRVVCDYAPNPLAFQEWIVRPPHGATDPGRLRRIDNGSIVRLTHRVTARNLHSHLRIPSPVSAQQEVTCFGTVGEGDSNDNWRIEFLTSRESGLGYDVLVRLIHENSGVALHSHRVRVADFQEVTGFSARDRNDLWLIEAFPSWRPHPEPTALDAASQRSRLRFRFWLEE